MSSSEKKRSDTAGSQGRQIAQDKSQSARTGRLSPASYDEPFGQLRREFDRLLDRFLPNWPGRRGDSERGYWGLDLDERDDAVTVRAEAPGFEPGDFDIQVRGNQLTLCACHEMESDENAPTHHWQRQELHRTVTLPAEVKTDKVDANYRNGVLTVTLPKATPASSQRIAVKG